MALSRALFCAAPLSRCTHRMLSYLVLSASAFYALLAFLVFFAFVMCCAHKKRSPATTLPSLSRAQTPRVYLPAARGRAPASRASNATRASRAHIAPLFRASFCLFLLRLLHLAHRICAHGISLPLRARASSPLQRHGFYHMLASSSLSLSLFFYILSFFGSGSSPARVIFLLASFSFIIIISSLRSIASCARARAFFFLLFLCLALLLPLCVCLLRARTLSFCIPLTAFCLFGISFAFTHLPLLFRFALPIFLLHPHLCMHTAASPLCAPSLLVTTDRERVVSHLTLFFLPYLSLSSPLLPLSHLIGAPLPLFASFCLFSLHFTFPLSPLSRARTRFGCARARLFCLFYLSLSCTHIIFYTLFPLSRLSCIARARAGARAHMGLSSFLSFFLSLVCLYIYIIAWPLYTCGYCARAHLASARISFYIIYHAHLRARIFRHGFHLLLRASFAARA